MALDPLKKADIIKKFSQGDGDTGSPEVQVALLTYSINDLTGHLKQHKKDNHSRKGLLKQVAKRRRLLNFLKKKSEKRFDALIKELKIKG
jgi:small subunit ribosomal protein S15